MLIKDHKSPPNATTKLELKPFDAGEKNTFILQSLEHKLCNTHSDLDLQASFVSSALQTQDFNFRRRLEISPAFQSSAMKTDTSSVRNKVQDSFIVDHFSNTYTFRIQYRRVTVLSVFACISGDQTRFFYPDFAKVDWLKPRDIQAKTDKTVTVP